jgi:putative heme-binding domain-containing protein
MLGINYVKYCSFALVLVVALAATAGSAERIPGSLQAQLVGEGTAALAQAAMESGDPNRGAVAFHQPTLACNRCHSTNGKPGAIGPDLATWPKRPTTAEIVESLLEPSRTIRSGFETAVVTSTDGRQILGLLVEADEREVVLRNPTTGETTAIPAGNIEEWSKTPQSSMPADIVNQLGTRQQFLDLVRYVREIADGGPPRARELQPPAALLVARPLPEYESHVDHAGLIRSFDAKAFARGEQIYERLCANCHGDHDRPGSLPTSRRFGVEPLKNGADPYAMYQTLTRGFGMMVPQHWMVPRQKYDVIHYLREAYLARRRPQQYVEITEGYLAGLPWGDTFGPAPSKIEPWSAMDYGPSLVHTYEFGRDGGNIAYKGIAVRLDGGAGGVSRGRAWAVFEHDTLRLAGFWTGAGFIDWKGIQFDGQHGVHPRVVGDVHVENIGPGWANPADGSFRDEKRVMGRDGRRYGPLPRDWGRYEGLSHSGSLAILHYRVGKTPVLEAPGLVEVQLEGEAKATPVLTRSFEIGPRAQELVLAVATHSSDAATLTEEGRFAILGAESPESPESTGAKQPFRFDGESYLEVAGGDEIDTTKSFTVTARLRTKQGGAIFARTTPGPKWVPGGQVLFVRGGRLCYDIGWVGVVQSNVRIDDGAWHDVAVVFDEETGAASVFVDGQQAGSKRLRPQAELDQPVVRLGFCAPDFPEPSAFVGELQEVRCFAQSFDAERLNQLAAGEDAGVRPLGHWQPGEQEGDVRNLSGEHFTALVRRTGEAESRGPGGTIVAGVAGTDRLAWKRVESRLCLVAPPGDDLLRFTVWTTSVDSAETAAAVAASPEVQSIATPELSSLAQGGPPRWPQVIMTQTEMGESDGPFTVDVLTHPETNPWLAQVRFTGLDFFEDGDSAALCSWDGDVWRVEGLRDPSGKLAWRRIASGLFQPLGLKIVDGRIHITCRDQLAILHDRNGDGETDFYECFNSDHQVTEHFHEFAMGLQRDAAGNFYYAKSARHALPAVIPHHGTLLRVSPDGDRTDIIATGFRAANGVCLNPDGTFFVTDQEGHWTPKNRINWVREGRFYGNMLGYHGVTDQSDDAMEPPLCWITNAFDRSPAELLWVDSRAWKQLDGRLLNLSYGYGRVYVVPHEMIEIDGKTVMQGGVCPLPLPDLPTGIARGRFHAGDGQLYACGMFAWAGNQQQPGGFYRIRRTDRAVHLPVAFHARKGELELGFSSAFDRESATDVENYTVQVWSLRRSSNYGSEHIAQRTLKVAGVRIQEDGKTLVLQIPDLAPTMGLAVRWDLKSAEGRPVAGELHGTIHHLR